jgi:hypothetical protein
MSFFNKIIDRAKHVNKEDKQQQQQISEPTKERSFFGIHTPHSSTSSSNPIMDNQQQQQQHLQKVQEETPTTNLYASGYVTPRQSQDLHQNMDIDTPGKKGLLIEIGYS